MLKVLRNDYVTITSLVRNKKFNDYHYLTVEWLCNTRREH